jgi:hypothetical protein
MASMAAKSTWAAATAQWEVPRAMVLANPSKCDGIDERPGNQRVEMAWWRRKLWVDESTFIINQVDNLKEEKYTISKSCQYYVQC